MSFLKLLDQFDIGNLDNDEKDRFLSRKEALGKISQFSKGLAVTALPLGAVAAFSSPAMAASNDDLVSTLNFALTLEYLEAEFYQKGNDSGVIDAADAEIFTQIGKHETAHVAFLKDVISNSLGGTPVDKPTFDFTAGGSFDPFNENGTGQATAYAQFMALSQAFEDTGVRAYKGQAGNVQSSAVVLTAALQIHSVEARHAAEVRRLRGLKGWITQDMRGDGMPDATQPVYDGEENTTQGGVDVTTITDASADAVTEGWDEPLNMDQVNAVASLFIQS